MGEYRKELESLLPSLYSTGLNIDHYPTNFIVQNSRLYYIDYECNEYDPKWDFDNRGRQYWGN